MVGEAVSLPYRDYLYGIIFDYRNADLVDINSTTVRKLSSFLMEKVHQQKLHEKVSCPVASLVSDNVVLGYARMFQILNEHALKMKMIVTTDEEKARRWAEGLSDGQELQP